MPSNQVQDRLIQVISHKRDPLVTNYKQLRTFVINNSDRLKDLLYMYVKVCVVS